MKSTNRRLSFAIWAFILLFATTWWGLSYRYGIGFAVTGPPIAKSTHSHRGAGPSQSGIALTSGMGKAILYISWSSAFTRKGFIFEPVLAHEFPHPWFGFQNEGGRIWISFPIGAAFGFAMSGALWSSASRLQKRQSR